MPRRLTRSTRRTGRGVYRNPAVTPYYRRNWLIPSYAAVDKAGSDTLTFTITESAFVGVPIDKAGSDTLTFTITESPAISEITVLPVSDTLTFTITESAVRNTVGPTWGTWLSPAIALPEVPIAGSIVYWQVDLPLGGNIIVETSTDNAASWQLATNKGPIDRLPIGSDSARSVLVRVTMSRALPEDDTPRLHLLELRVAIDGSVDEYCQLGRFTLDDTEVVDGPTGLVLRLIGADLSRKIALNTWDESLVIDEGTNLNDAIETIISNRWPEATFNLASTEWSVTRLFYGEGVGSGNPWTDARNLARDGGLELFLDAFGVVTSRAVSDPDAMPAVWVFEDSAHPTIIDLSRRMTNENTFNQVIVTGESTSNDVPVRAIWQDTDPTSRTYIDGLYGRRTKTIRSEKVRTTEQAQAVADAEGLKIKGATEIVRINVLVAPFLEPGDVVEVDRSRSKTAGRFTTDGWTISLGAEELMTLNARRQRQ